jgi:hypothetical protein
MQIKFDEKQLRTDRNMLDVSPKDKFMDAPLRGLPVLHHGSIDDILTTP